MILSIPPLPSPPTFTPVLKAVELFRLTLLIPEKVLLTLTFENEDISVLVRRLSRPLFMATSLSRRRCCSAISSGDFNGVSDTSTASGSGSASSGAASSSAVGSVVFISGCGGAFGFGGIISFAIRGGKLLKSPAPGGCTFMRVIPRPASV